MRQPLIYSQCQKQAVKQAVAQNKKIIIIIGTSFQANMLIFALKYYVNVIEGVKMRIRSFENRLEVGETVIEVVKDEFSKIFFIHK